MALFSLCNKLSFPRTLNTLYSKLHTFKKLESFSLVKRNLTPSVTSKRNFFWIFRKPTKREVRVKDNPPESYELIYRNGIDHYFLAGQYGIFFLSVSVTIIALYYSYTWTDSDERTISVEKISRPVSNDLLGIYAAFAFTACLFYFYLARIPMRIYCYPEKQTYLMYFYGPVPNQIKKQTLLVSDITPLPDKGITPWSSLMYEHKSGQKLILFDNFFRYPADLYVMLGWQKDPKVEGYKKVEDNK